MSVLSVVHLVDFQTYVIGKTLSVTSCFALSEKRFTVNGSYLLQKGIHSVI